MLAGGSGTRTRQTACEESKKNSRTGASGLTRPIALRKISEFPQDFSLSFAMEVVDFYVIEPLYKIVELLMPREDQPWVFLRRGKDTVSEQKPIEVAIIGGWCAGVTAAFDLTRPEHKGKYHVTVYQLG